MLNANTKNWSIQDYLSIGYLYLLLLGIIKNVIYYGFLGVNIINYSGLMDILLSPISFLADRIMIPIILILLILIAVAYAKSGPILHKKYKLKSWYKKIYNIDKLDKRYENPSNKLVLFFSTFIIASFFLGVGLGSGKKRSEQLKSKNFETTHKLTFNNEKEALNVKVFGQNSNFIFYALKKTNKIIVSPIQNNIIKIEKLDE